MIKKYGADSVRWFILSDSPPEKDVQWSDTGVSSANKFLQKLWNLNHIIINRKKCNPEKIVEEKFNNQVDSYVKKIDSSISGFKFNVAIANFYEVYSHFKNHIDKKVSNETLKASITNIMKILIPLTPHLAYECLEHLNAEDINVWPEIKSNKNEEIKLPIQINGKTRDVISILKDTDEKEIYKQIYNKPKLEKYFLKNKITKTNFIKNKIINYIIN